jgi:hypothetical protein
MQNIVLSGHEGDLLHMLDAALRMVDGERPHLDFMTPIGLLGFAPVAAFLAAGFTVGKAGLLASLAMLAAMLPAVWWVASTRLSKGQAYAFGAIIVFLMTGLAYGGGSTVLSLSMYYNRWGWAITFLLLITALFAPQKNMAEKWVAPLVIGGGMAALLMLKVTFFVPLLPALIILMLVQKKAGLLARAIAVALVIGLGLLAWLGVDFFLAYIEDLVAVTRDSSGRTYASASLFMMLLSPDGLVATLVLFASILMFRSSKQDEQGLVVFILAPVFIYITYQNWGNDPKWLLFLVLYLWANLPQRGEVAAFGLPARQTGHVLAVVAFVTILPSLIALAISAPREAMANSSQASYLELRGGVSDIWLPKEHMSTIIRMATIEGQPRMNPETALDINGFRFPDCVSGVTLVPAYAAMAGEIEALDEVQGKPVLMADVLNPIWMMADIGRVAGAAPWYYGDAAGLEGADYLAVPICARKPNLRAAMVKQAMAQGYKLNEVYRSEMLVLYAMVKPAE